MSTTIREKLKKLKTLAERGTEGEQKAAKAILDKLLKKYELDDEELDEEAVGEYTFEYHGGDEITLLCQVAYKVTGTSGNVYKVRNSRGNLLRSKCVVVCTLAQKVEIEFLFGFYTRLYKEERELFLEAFVQKHRIFGDADLPKDKVIKRSRAEIQRIIEMMNGLSDTEPYKALESKEDCNNE